MRQLILYILFLMSMVFAGYGEVSAASVSYTSDPLPKKDKLAKVEYDQHQGDAQLENASELAYCICSSRPQRLLPSGNMHGNQSASRLLSNRIHLLFTLLSAIDGAMKFWGGSFVTNAQGKLLYLASHDAEETEATEVDLQQSNFFRIHWPFLRDRRIDSYEPIMKRFIDE